MSQAAPADSPVPLSVGALPTRFDGWWIVLACALAQGLGTGMISIYGFVVTPIVAEFGATDTQMGFGMSIMIFSMAIFGPVLGPALDRGPIKAIMLAGVGLALASLWVLVQATTLWQLALALAFCAVGFGLYGPLPVQVLLVNWFVARRGQALAVAGIGFSSASLLLPPLAAWWVAQFGWRHAVAGIATLAALAVAPPLALFVVKRPEDRGQIPDGRTALPSTDENDRRASLADVAAGEIVRDRNFWLIGIGMGAAQSVPIAGLFLVRHMEGFDIAPERAALAFVVMGFFGIIGKLSSGTLGDRYDERLVTVAVILIYFVGWSAMATTSSFELMLVAAVPMGLGAGGMVPMAPLMIGACFGRAVVGKVAGMQAGLGLPFLLASAPLVGAVRDETGDYVLAFMGLAVLLLFAAALIGLTRVPKRS